MKPTSCFAASLGKRTQMATVDGGSNLILVEILGPVELGERRELEEGTRGESLWPPFLFCSILSSFIHAVGPSSLVLCSQLPLPQDWPSFPYCPQSCPPGFLLAHL